MDLILALSAFLGGIVCCMIFGFSLAWALLLGFICFFLVGLRRGFSSKELLGMAATGGKTAFVVLRILILIGLLTALWRSSGTIAFFVYTGLKVITPRLFIMVAFLLPGILCLAFGSSFGVAGTAGVVLMVIARSGQANLLVTAGAILSGCYFGERLSPASSAAALTAAVSGVEQEDFQRRMWRTSPLPIFITLVAYGVLSYLCPIQSVDPLILTALEEGFSLSPLTVLPAAVLLILPLFHITAATSIAISCGLAGILSMAVQGMSLFELVRTCILGCTVAHPVLTDILSGGGLLSMANTILIVFLSCAYSEIFNGTGLLNTLKDLLYRLSKHIGLFATTCLVSLASAGLLCNQTVCIVMTAQMVGDLYEKDGHSPLELSEALGNSAINLAGLVPWCIACSVPLATIGGSIAAIPFGVFLYAVPLCTLLRKKR